MTHLSLEMKKCATMCQCTLTALSKSTESQRCSSKTAMTKLMAIVAVFLPGSPGPETTQNINIEMEKKSCNGNV